MQKLILTPPARPSRATDIIIGGGVVKHCPQALRGASKIVILFDEGVRPIATSVADLLGSPLMIPVKSGDASKSLAEVERIAGLMLEAGCTRHTTLVAVGGGMLTDLGGFVASVFMRGIPCILIPTTLLSMVDAAIGGKTGVNTGHKKNMIGTITHPKAVLIDSDFLSALPEGQIQEGMSEIVKIAAIIDRPFFEWIEASVGSLQSRNISTLTECVVRAVGAKVKIVEQDEHDRDQRLLLNFGHTVGHAVEALSKYELPHGRAVSIGMEAEMLIAGFSDRERVSSLLTAFGLPLALPSTMKRGDLWRLMRSDKKNEGDAVKMAVPKHLGEGIVMTITEKQFSQLP